MSKVAIFFRTFLEKRPILGNAIVYGTLCVAAETSQQVINKKVLANPSQPLELSSIGRYAIYGTGIGGPLLTVWCRFLDKKLPGATMRTVVKKLLLDQFLFTPNLLIIFYVSMSILERKPNLLEECKEKFVHTYMANCLFWMPMQTINFSIVSPLYRVTYIGTCSFAWINILCWFKRQEVTGKSAIEPVDCKQDDS